MFTKKLGKSIGIEITGLNTKVDLSKKIKSKISDLLSEFSVVVIRNQNITNDEHIKFSQYFGTLETTKADTDG